MPGWNYSMYICSRIHQNRQTIEVADYVLWGMTLLHTNLTIGLGKIIIIIIIIITCDLEQVQVRTFQSNADQQSTCAVAYSLERLVWKPSQPTVPHYSTLPLPSAFFAIVSLVPFCTLHMLAWSKPVKKPVKRPVKKPWSWDVAERTLAPLYSDQNQT